MNLQEENPSSIANWRNENPLRRWRKRKSLSRSDLAVLLSRSERSIQLLESGSVATPHDAFFETFAILSERAVEPLKKEWSRWYRFRPTQV